ncbi:MAG: aldehyde dehydrogenase family protein [Fidelibacterota bacterium]|nr:MAG: aldehyde dehydrogenase family protein [Candidatus Neomarinimicrobiota bacterium]
MSATIETNAAGKTVLKCFNPATGESLGALEAHSLEEVDQALERLRESAASYNRTAIRERVKLVRRFRKAITKNLDRIIEMICTETGKKPPDALLEIFAALEIIRHQERLATSVLGRQYRTSGTFVHKRAYVDFRPFGVAVVISPWNYPFILVVSPTVESLLAGNTVVAKPSEYTSLTGLFIKDLFDEATGRSELLEIVLGTGEVGQHLVRSPLTDVINFTGSTKVGKLIAQSCAESLKPAVLELGGKDPMLVMEDANLKRAAKSAVWGGFTNAGQTCMAVERIYVVASVYDEFLRLVREEAQKLTVGRGPDDAVGAVTVDVQYDKITAHIEDAEARGGKIEMFGEPDGRHMPPFLVTNVDHSMLIMTDETFGPELAVMPVVSEEEAIEKANDSRFGLSAYIFTGSERRGRRIASKLMCGTVAINDVLIQYGVASLPFGGHGDSGLGAVHGIEGLRNMSRQQSVVGSRIMLPMELWWYDLGQKTYKMLCRFVKLRFR